MNQYHSIYYITVSQLLYIFTFICLFLYVHTHVLVCAQCASGGQRDLWECILSLRHVSSGG